MKSKVVRGFFFRPFSSLNTTYSQEMKIGPRTPENGQQNKEMVQKPQQTAYVETF
jgi:hypothetical protein